MTMMKSLFLAALCMAVFLCTAMVMANDKPTLDTFECLDNRDCQTWYDMDKYCRPRESILPYPGSCDTTSKVSDFDTTLERKHQCEKGFYNSGSKCFRLAAPGCRFEKSQEDRFKCAGSKYKDGECKADEPEEDPGTITTIGRRCKKPSIISDRSEICSERANLYCNKYGICEKKPSIYERCSAEAPCAWPSVCSNGFCKPFHSVNDYVFESDRNVCQSGGIGGGLCTPTYYSQMPRKCFSNSDCGSGVCDRNEDNQDESGRGICVSWEERASIRLQQCYSANCVDVDKDQCEHDRFRCMSAFVTYHCSRKCGQRPDYRYDVSLPYVFDCKDLTFVNMTGNGNTEERLCEVEEQFLNCDAVQWYEMSAAPSIHSASSVTLVIGLVIAMVSLIL